MATTRVVELNSPVCDQGSYDRHHQEQEDAHQLAHKGRAHFRYIDRLTGLEPERLLRGCGKQLPRNFESQNQEGDSP